MISSSSTSSSFISCFFPSLTTVRVFLVANFNLSIILLAFNSLPIAIMVLTTIMIANNPFLKDLVVNTRTNRTIFRMLKRVIVLSSIISFMVLEFLSFWLFTKPLFFL